MAALLPLAGGILGVATLAAGPPVGPVHAQIGPLANALDVPDQNGRRATLAALMTRQGKKGFRFPLPLGVITARSGAFAFLVETRLAIVSRTQLTSAGRARRHDLATAADTRRADWHQATGRRVAPPLIATAPAAIDVPEFLVSTTRA